MYLGMQLIGHGRVGWAVKASVVATFAWTFLWACKHTFKSGPGAPGMGHWLYALPTAPFTKMANGPFKWGLQHRLGLAAPGAGHLCGKQLPGAKQPCKAPLDHLGRHVAWCARRAREIRNNRLRDFLVECTKTTGAIAATEQAIPLPRDSQPAARETRAVHTADIHILEPNGTDIWVDV